MNFNEAQGRKLALEMLVKIGRRWNQGTDSDNADMVNIDPEILRDYLARLEKLNPETWRGFLCVVSEFIGQEMAAQYIGLAPSGDNDGDLDCLERRYQVRLRGKS